MRQTLHSLCLFVVVLSMGAPSTADDKEEPWNPTETLKAATKKGREYRELFEKVGRSGLVDLLKDKDTGTSLQAAWELNRKIITLPVATKRDTDDTYDPEGIRAFLKHVRTRTELSIPDWWQKNLLENICVRKDDAHFVYGTRPDMKKVSLGASAKVVSADVWMAESETLSLQDKLLTFKTDKRSVVFSESIWPYQSNSLASCTVGDTTALAMYRQAGGPCPLLSFDHVNKKQIWSARVWGWARAFAAPGVDQHIELVATKDLIAVFGTEFRGVFLECFDAKSGEVKFRFCSSYWGFNSERWILK